MTPLALATVFAGCYAALCWLKPFGRCRRCRKSGVRPRLITRRLTVCRACKGAGLRLRHGRRAFNYLARIHADAQTARAARQNLGGPR
ncbi:hypothetical protein ACQP2F_40990 [Actinoplanes sp. CA-030573]|uniref:hypothetical protein n=1 Tax=Actinoplanes sp. CA-030573 TaxID=3239898 RepID=UPI003D8B2014